MGYNFISGHKIYYVICENERYKDKLLYDSNFNNTISYLLNTDNIDAEIVVSLISNLCDIIKERDIELMDWKLEKK